MNRFLPWLTIVLLLAAEAVAMPPGELMQATATEVRFDGGISVVGNLGAVHAERPPTGSLLEDPGRDSRVRPARMELQAVSVEAITDFRRGDPSVLAMSGPGATEQERIQIDGAAGRMTFRDGFQFFAGAHGNGSTVTIMANGGMVAAAQSAVRVGNQMVAPTTTRPIEAAPGPLDQWTEPTEWETLRIEGDFAIMIWEMDAEFATAAGTVVIRTGFFFENGLPASTGDVALYGSTEQRQAYLYVTDGVLDFFFDAAPDLTLTLQAQSAHAKRVAFEDAQGTLQTPEGVQPVDHTRVTLEGAIDVQFAGREGQRLVAQASGSVAEAMAGGRHYVYPAGAATTAVPGLTLLLGAAGLVLLALAGGVLGAARRKGVAREMHALEFLMDANRYREAIAAATPRLVASRRHGTDAQVIRTVSLLRLGRTAEAEATLEGWRGARDATLDYLWAFLHALRGEARQARERVAMCLGKDPSMEDDVASNAVLRAVLAQPGPAAPVQREGYS